jgi:hypothetical protein
LARSGRLRRRRSGNPPIQPGIRGRSGCFGEHRDQCVAQPIDAQRIFADLLAGWCDAADHARLNAIGIGAFRLTRRSSRQDYFTTLLAWSARIILRTCRSDFSRRSDPGSRRWCPSARRSFRCRRGTNRRMPSQYELHALSHAVVRRQNPTGLALMYTADVPNGNVVKLPVRPSRSPRCAGELARLALSPSAARPPNSVAALTKKSGNGCGLSRRVTYSPRNGRPSALQILRELFSDVLEVAEGAGEMLA